MWYFASLTIGAPAEHISDLLPHCALYVSINAPYAKALLLLIVAAIALFHYNVYLKYGRSQYLKFLYLFLSVLLLSVSYRFPAFLMVLGACFLLRHARDARLVPYLVALMALTILLSVSPIDVSLQNVKGGPHLAKAISGLLNSTGYEWIAEGQAVAVDGCVMTYNEPRYILVW